MWLYAIVLMLISGFSFWACSTEQSAHNEAKTILAQINSTLEDASQKDIALNQLTDFSWNKVHLATPYSDLRQDLLDSGIKNININTYNIAQREDINLLVFIEKNSVVKILPLSRIYIDFQAENAQQLFDTSVQISKSDLGTNTFALR